MENNSPADNAPPEKKSSPGCLRALGIAALCALIIVVIIAGWVKYNIYASPYTPTKLSIQEQKVLDSKMSVLTESSHRETALSSRKKSKPSSSLKPEAYSEEGARREISLTEKELNALIANKPEIARSVAIDLSENLVSLKLVVPVDDEIIFFGGKTLRLNMGVVLGYENNSPVVAIKGVSLGGIPIPNAWLGYMKGKNLIQEFGTETGFWKLFAEGVKDVRVQEGHIRIRLKE